MPTGTSFWILRPFNALFCITFALFILLLIVVSLLVKKKSDAVKRRVLIGACFLTMIGFVAYKVFLSMDADYNVISANMGGFNWWGELPMHLCNINMLLLPYAVWKNKRSLMSFCFFLGPLGAMMALAMPGNGFDGYSLLLPRMLGYFGTHFMIVIEALALATFGLYRPKFADLPRTVVTALCISLVIFGVNMLLRWSGLHPRANYFYSVETEGNFILEIFHGWIPYPWLYQLPCIVILGVYMTIVTSGFALFSRKGKK